MTRRFFGLQGALLGGLLFGSCKQDSITTVGIGTAAGVSLELKTRTIALADSVRTFALVRDQVGNPLAIAVTLTTGCTAGIVSVGAASDAPLVRTAFIVRAVGYGTGCVIASAAGFVDTMKVTAVPASLVVTGETGTIAGKPDTASSGAVVTYSYAYKDAAGVVLTGLPASTTPSFSTADTTIAQAGASVGQFAARGPGVVTISVSGTAGLSTSKILAVLPLSPFTGTTSSPVDPGAILTITRDMTSPVDTFDNNTKTSVGTIIAATRTKDVIQVRISDLSSAGPKTFSITGIGPNDLAYSGGTYTVNAPAAFGGTFVPNPVNPTQTVKVTRAVGDPAFASSMKVFRATPGGSLAAVTPVSGSITADSFKLSTSDLNAVGSYAVRITELGATNLARQGSYTLAVGAYGGTVTPSSGIPAGKIILKRAVGDPLFDADTRVYFDGIRTFIDQSSTDTAVVAVPPVEHTGPVDIRLTRLDAGQFADTTVGFSSSTALALDQYGYANFTSNRPDTNTIKANGKYYITLSGPCAGTSVGGVATKGTDKCDSYFRITNNTAAAATVTVTANWLSGVSVDFYICNGAALSNPAPNNVPSCGTAFANQGTDLVNSDGASNVVGGSGTATAAESATFTLPANSTYIIWVNLYDGSAASSSLIKLTLSGLP
jgi:hypothetical protein